MSLEPLLTVRGLGKSFGGVKAVDGISFEVRRGETLRTIAEAHGVTRAQLRAANDLASERVRAGEVLEIPSS